MTIQRAAAAAVLLLVVVSARPAAALQAAAAGPLAARADSLVCDMARGDFAAVERRLDETMRAALPAARLEQLWATVQAPAGAPYTAEEVTVRTPAGHVLTGTLTLPAGAGGPLPAVVLASGSGPQDRDGASAAIPGYRPFRQIADTLARRGIAVLRLDDRGVGGSGGVAPDVTVAHFADDVRAAVAYLRGRSEIAPGRIGLVGHSEGGVTAPMVAAADPRIRAVALLAAPSRRGREVSMYQNRALVDAIPELTAAQRDSIMAAVPAQLDAAARTSAYLRFWFDYDPLSAARRVRAPVLVLQGATDRQVPEAQARELAGAIRAAGNRDVTLRVFPAVNHLFLPDPEGTANVQRYAGLPSKDVPPVVLGALADWLAAKLR